MANRRLVALLMWMAAPLAAVNLPKEVSSSDWDQIRAAYEKHRHAVVRTGDGWSARNPGQQWVTRFDGRGFEVTPDGGSWKWGLEVVRYGGTLVKGRAAARVEGNRITYSRDADLSEWFVNDRRGLEHGFTVRRRPAGSKGPLEIELAVRGGLTPRASTDGRSVSFDVVQYAGLKVWDADQRVLPARLTVQRDRVRLTVEDAGARYPVTIDPIAQQAYLKASNTGAADAFGGSVAVSGDTVVVGAPGEDSAATGVNGNQADNTADDSGAAYVFVRSGGVWTQQAYLKASNTNAGDGFGWCVAVSGDTVAVGAPGEDSAATRVNGNQVDNSALWSGAAYVFVRSGGVWGQQAYLKASNTGAEDWFGDSVTVSGDTVVVGASLEDSAATGVDGSQADDYHSGGYNRGAAYVFVRSEGVWTQQAYLKASNRGGGFGRSVSVSGDAVVVGAPGDSSAATGVNGNQVDSSAVVSGAAYVFVRRWSVWRQQAYLKASNTQAHMNFGNSVALSGDTVLVGAALENSGATGVNGNQGDNTAVQSGAVYVFTGVTSAPVGQKYVPITPCRIVDTRPAYAGPRTGAFGPPMLTAGVTRTILVQSSTSCNIPASAKVYVFNVTADTIESQTGPIDYVTLWPAGGPRPEFMTLRTTTGGYIANAAIVEAGIGGAINAFSSNNTNLIIDITGYFTSDPATPGYLYYPVNPCRAVDTRGAVYSSLPSPYGNQRMQAAENRTFRLPGSPGCQLPAAPAYSMQLTLAC